MSTLTADESSLCDTAKLLASVLDGASERAILIADDGTILYMNDSARHFLLSSARVQDIFVCKDWQSVQHCRVVMKDSSTTRTERNIHLTKLAPCPCCGAQYYTTYICSKHERVREVVDHSFDPVITADETGKICTVNIAATHLFGYEASEMVGHSLSMICGGGHAENHDQYMRNYMETGVKKILGKKREVLAKKKNGTEFPCELGVQEISDVSSGKRYFCAFVKDLTLLKQHEAELQEAQALAQGMINSAFDPMLEIDEVGIIKVVNDAACSMFGYTREEFNGSNISMICGGGHAEKHASYMQRYKDTGIKHIIGRKRQVMARRKDGSEFDVELGVQEVTLTTGKKAFCGFIRDLTQLKKDKRALQKQARMIQNKFFEEPSAEDGGECPAK